MNQATAILNGPNGIHLHIRQLVIDGVPLAPLEVPHFRAAMEEQLGQMLASVPANAWTNGAVAQLKTAPLHLAANGSPQSWGRQVAQNVFPGLAPRINTNSIMKE